MEEGQVWGDCNKMISSDIIKLKLILSRNESKENIDAQIDIINKLRMDNQQSEVLKQEEKKGDEGHSFKNNSHEAVDNLAFEDPNFKEYFDKSQDDIKKVENNIKQAKLSNPQNTKQIQLFEDWIAKKNSEKKAKQLISSFEVSKLKGKENKKGSKEIDERQQKLIATENPISNELVGQDFLNQKNSSRIDEIEPKMQLPENIARQLQKILLENQNKAKQENDDKFIQMENKFTNMMGQIIHMTKKVEDVESQLKVTKQEKAEFKKMTRFQIEIFRLKETCKSLKKGVKRQKIQIESLNRRNKRFFNNLQDIKTMKLRAQLITLLYEIVSKKAGYSNFQSIKQEGFKSISFQEKRELEKKWKNAIADLPFDQKSWEILVEFKDLRNSIWHPSLSYLLKHKKHILSRRATDTSQTLEVFNLAVLIAEQYKGYI